MTVMHAQIIKGMLAEEIAEVPKHMRAAEEICKSAENAAVRQRCRQLSRLFREDYQPFG